MRRTVGSLALLSLFALVACGNDSEPSKGKPEAPPTIGPGPKSPAADLPMPKPTPPPAAFTGTGVVEAQGPSTTMQGTHRLVDGGKTVCLLESKKVDLKAHEGKKAKVTGPARTTVEGGLTIVDVQTIEDLP